MNLTAAPAQGGTATVNIPPQNGSCYTSGTSVTLTAAPANAGWAFTHWQGTGIPTSPSSITVVMNQSRTIVANFTDCYNLYTSKNPEQGGTISLDPPPPPNSCYPIGTNVTLTAEANDGFEFLQWGLNGSGANPVFVIQMNGVKFVAANFSGSYTLSGKVTETGTTFGVPNAVVEVDANGKKLSAVTDAQGNYAIPSVPLALAGSSFHPVRISRGCYSTLTSTVPANQMGTVTSNFALTTLLGIGYFPAKPTVGQNVNFYPSNECPEVNSYSWSLDVNNPPSPTATSKTAIHSYATTGTKRVTLNVTRTNGLPAISAFTDVLVTDCRATAASFNLLSAPVGNSCLLGLDYEPISFVVDVHQNACDATTVQSVEWKHNGIDLPGTSLEKTVNLGLGSNRVTAKVNYTFKGQAGTKTFEKIAPLDQKCGLDPFEHIIIRPKEIKVEEKQSDGQGGFIFRHVEGNVIVDEDGGGATVKLTQNVVADCPCRFTISFVRINHKAPNGDFVYTGNPKDNLVLVRGAHEMTLHFTVTDVLTGAVTPMNADTRFIRVLPPDPEVVQSRFACGVPPQYDHAFWNYPLPSEELDFSVPDHELKGSGQDFEGAFDDGLFKHDLVAGDFVLTAGMKSWTGMNAGLMIRESGSAWSPMVFFGREGAGGIFISQRAKFRMPTVRTNVSHNADQTCLRMEREDGILTFFTAQGQADPGNVNRILCPDAGWQAVEVSAGVPLQFTGWPGLVRLGLAAAGNPEAKAVFNDLSIEGEVTPNGRRWVNEITQPQTIFNTRFTDGNLVSNWSFENIQPYFNPVSAAPALGWESLSEPAPFEGRFFARVTDKPAGNTVMSPKSPILFENDGKSTSKIALRMMVRTSLTGLQPRIVFHLEDGTSQTLVLGASFPAGSGWSPYVSEFTAPSADVVSFQVELINSATAFTGTVDIDNVSLAPVMGGEQNLSITAVTFSDGVDRPFQTVNYSKDEDFVKASILDGQARFQRDLPTFTVKKTTDPSGFRGVKRDPVALMKTYYEEDETDGNNIAVDWIDTKPRLMEFQERHGFKYFERSPLARLDSAIGRLPSQNVSYAYTNDFQTGLVSPEPQYANHTVRLVHSDFDRAKGEFNTREEHRDPFGNIVRVVDKGKPLDAAGTCEGQPVSTNKNCTDLVSVKDVDILDRPWVSVSPKGVADPAKADAYSTGKLLNTLNQVTATSNPSGRGSTEAMHDALGHLRLFRDGNKIAANQFLVNSYDAFARQTRILLVSDPSGTLWSQDNADDPDWPGNLSAAQVVQEFAYDAPPASLPIGLSASDMRNLRGRRAASYAYSSEGVVAKYFSYDERGRVEATWLKILNLPLQKISTHTNLGEKTVKVELDGKTPNTQSSVKKTEEYLYDDLLRTRMVLGGVQTEVPTPLFEYNYWADGKTRSAAMGHELKHRMAFRYDVTERLIHQRHELINASTSNWEKSFNYEQKLRYNGQDNVDLQSYMLRAATVGERYRAIAYKYDHFKRLTKADFGKSSLDWPLSDTDPFFNATNLDAALSYNEDGALASLGYQGTAPAVYNYEGDSHRLSSVGTSGQLVIPGGKDRSAAGNFKYDWNGNMIADQSTKRKITFDYRNLPLSIIQCVDMAAYECVGVKTTTNFVYDDAGNRVAKIGRK